MGKGVTVQPPALWQAQADFQRHRAFALGKRSGTRSGGPARELQATLIDRGERSAASGAEYIKDEDKKDNKKRGMAYGYGKN